MVFDDGFFAWGSIVFFCVSLLTLFVCVMLRKHENIKLHICFYFVAILLFLCTAFSQDVSSSWLSSIALLVFSLSMFFHVLLLKRDFSGRLFEVVSVVKSALVVLRWCAFVDLCILVLLSLYERVAPYYLNFVF